MGFDTLILGATTSRLNRYSTHRACTCTRVQLSTGVETPSANSNRTGSRSRLTSRLPNLDPHSVTSKQPQGVQVVGITSLPQERRFCLSYS